MIESSTTTMSVPSGPSSSLATAAQSLQKTRKPRRSKKRLRFNLPDKAAPSLREIWQRANAKQKEEAHRLGVVILETWLGRTTRKEAASKLGIPQVRLHQLSQQATTGLITALLVQPKSRRRNGRLPESPDELTVTRKECDALKKENEELKRLLEVFRGLPRLGRDPREGLHAKGGVVHQKI